MDSFLGKLGQWISGAQHQGTAVEDDVQVAAAALMVHAMRIDDHPSLEEKVRVRDVLRDRFDLNETDLDDLIQQGTEADDSAIDLYRFTKILTGSLDQAGRKRIVRMLWELVVADGNIDEFETNLVWRVAELIGVSREDRIKLRQEVLAAD